MVKSKIIRIICIILGFICLGLGVVAIILPFLNSKIYKKYLENFSKNRVMTIYGELILLSLVSLMIVMTMFIVNNLTVSIILTILILLKYSYFIFRVKNIDLSKQKNNKNKIVIEEQQ